MTEIKKLHIYLIESLQMFVITHSKQQMRVALLNPLDKKGTRSVSISMPVDIGLRFHVKRHDGQCEYPTGVFKKVTLHMCIDTIT